MDVVKLAEKIVAEMKQIDAGKSDGSGLDVLTEQYLAAQREIDAMPA